MACKGASSSVEISSSCSGTGSLATVGSRKYYTEKINKFSPTKIKLTKVSKKIDSVFKVKQEGNLVRFDYGLKAQQHI